MEKNLLIKFKKYGLYVLAVIGILAILIVLWKLAFKPPITPYQYDRAVSVAPLRQGFEGQAPGGFLEPSFVADEGGFVARKILTEIPTETVELTERKVIKNGSLEILVDRAEETAEEIKRIAKDFEGFVENVNIYEVSKDVKEGVVTIRVTADRFDEA